LAEVWAAWISCLLRASRRERIGRVSTLGKNRLSVLMRSSQYQM
jgi:hypothetical protein